MLQKSTNFDEIVSFPRIWLIIDDEQKCISIFYQMRWRIWVNFTNLVSQNSSNTTLKNIEKVEVAPFYFFLQLRLLATVHYAPIRSCAHLMWSKSGAAQSFVTSNSGPRNTHKIYVTFQKYLCELKNVKQIFIDKIDFQTKTCLPENKWKHPSSPRQA